MSTMEEVYVMVFVRHSPDINGHALFDEVVWFGHDSLLSIVPENIYKKIRLNILQYLSQGVFTEIQLIKKKR